MGSHQEEGFQPAQSGTLGAGGAMCCSAPRERTGALMEQLGGPWMWVWETQAAARLVGYHSRSDVPGSILRRFLLGLNSCLPK